MTTFQGKKSFCEGSLHFKDSWSTSEEEFWLQKIRHYAGGPNGMDYIKYIFFNYFKKGESLHQYSGDYEYQVPKQGFMGRIALGGVMKRALYCLIEDIILNFNKLKTEQSFKQEDFSWSEVLKKEDSLKLFIPLNESGEIVKPKKGEQIKLFPKSMKCQTSNVPSYDLNIATINSLTIYKMFETVNKILEYNKREQMQEKLLHSSIKNLASSQTQTKTFIEKLRNRVEKSKMQKERKKLNELDKKLREENEATLAEKNEYLKLKWKRGDIEDYNNENKKNVRNILIPNIIFKYFDGKTIDIAGKSWGVKKKISGWGGGYKKRKKRKSRRKKKRRKSKRRKSKRRKSKRRRKKHVSRKRS